MVQTLTLPAVALRDIEALGWWRGPGHLDKGVCLVTALIDITPERRDQAYAVIADVIMELYPRDYVLDGESDDKTNLCIMFNDDPRTKITHMRKVLREASRREQHAEA